MKVDNFESLTFGIIHIKIFKIKYIKIHVGVVMSKNKELKFNKNRKNNPVQMVRTNSNFSRKAPYNLKQNQSKYSLDSKAFYEVIHLEATEFIETYKTKIDKASKFLDMLEWYLVILMKSINLEKIYSNSLKRKTFILTNDRCQRTVTKQLDYLIENDHVLDEIVNDINHLSQVLQTVYVLGMLDQIEIVGHELIDNLVKTSKDTRAQAILDHEMAENEAFDDSNAHNRGPLATFFSALIIFLFYPYFLMTKNRRLYDPIYRDLFESFSSNSYMLNIGGSRRRI